MAALQYSEYYLVTTTFRSSTRITEVFGRMLQNTATGSVAVFFLYVQTASECAMCDTRVGKSWANNPWAFLPTIENPDTLLSRY